MEVLKSQDLQEGKYCRRLIFACPIIENCIHNPQGKTSCPQAGLSLGYHFNKAQYVYVSLHWSTILNIEAFVWTLEVYFLMALPGIFLSAEGNCSAEALTYLAPLVGRLKLWCPASFYFCNLLDDLGRFQPFSPVSANWLLSVVSGESLQIHISSQIC